ncbi:uncharacterized protein Z520_00252 [Fonsecaea multimorphosa CBS 102226]|uniref:Transcription factor domain-containing protein n=1 Tax=Fonsecaea multimorphosa CBS 102226 TaxID=1442371 RepID=A0A0D2HP05_9EURO|nr:uncharacterized protein Z520_00252 [Fonsecaea multimorphosa CBS 102226]KIY03561.1 hypothetical protein Z520_00252 [Fonsecaea multimorphosa CBS 102226]OAL32263.1 hypothetical protein AYO22_00285 [Fonsecaea multimorphosa]
MAQFDITFLPVLARDSSQRDRELYQATAKSHAARLSHKWRRGKRFGAGSANHQRRQIAEESQSIGASETTWNQDLVSPGLVSILQKGNSDPFDALAIHITPRVNQILTFYKHGYLPMIYPAFMGSEDAIRRIEALQTQEYHNGILALRLECSARALLLINVAFMIKTSPHEGLQDEALLLKHQTIKSLRRELVKGSVGQTQSLVLDSVAMLFRGALIAGDLDEAALHANTLRTLLEQKYDREGGVMDLGFLLRVLYQNKQLSVFRFSLSIFDVEEWVPKVLASYLEPPKAYLEPFRQAMLCRLDPCVSAEPLRTLFVQTLFGDYVFGLPAELLPGEQLFSMVQVWIHIQGTILHSRLVDFILKTEALHHLNFDRATEQPMPSPRQNLYWQTQRALALAFLIMFEFNRTNLESVQTVFVNARDFLARLRSTLSLTTHVAEIVRSLAVDGPGDGDDDLTGEAPQVDPSNALLYALCVGSWTEKKHNPPSSRYDGNKHDPGNSSGGATRRDDNSDHHNTTRGRSGNDDDSDDDTWWFAENLARHARQMGLHSWRDVGGILHGFYDAHAYMPGLDEWVNRLLLRHT